MLEILSFQALLKWVIKRHFHCTYTGT